MIAEKKKKIQELETKLKNLENLYETSKKSKKTEYRESNVHTTKTRHQTEKVSIILSKYISSKTKVIVGIVLCVFVIISLYNLTSNKNSINSKEFELEDGQYYNCKSPSRKDCKRDKVYCGFTQSDGRFGYMCFEKKSESHDPRNRIMYQLGGDQLWYVLKHSCDCD